MKTLLPNPCTLHCGAAVGVGEAVGAGETTGAGVDASVRVDHGNSAAKSIETTDGTVNHTLEIEASRALPLLHNVVIVRHEYGRTASQPIR